MYTLFPERTHHHHQQHHPRNDYSNSVAQYECVRPHSIIIRFIFMSSVVPDGRQVHGQHSPAPLAAAGRVCRTLITHAYSTHKSTRNAEFVECGGVVAFSSCCVLSMNAIENKKYESIIIDRNVSEQTFCIIRYDPLQRE